MKHLKVAQVSATFPPYLAGTGNVCYHNAWELAKLGHDVVVFTSRFPDVDYTYPKEFTVKRYKPLVRLGNAPFLPGLLRLKRFDIVHLHYPFYFGSEIVFLKSLTTSLDYILTYHQDALFGGVLQFPMVLHHWLLGRRILRGASRVLATSTDYARASRLRELIHEKPEAVAELPNGVDVQRFHPEVDGNWLRSRYRLERTERVILFVGGLDKAHYFKGVEILLQALTHIPDQGIRLLVVGDGDLQPAYQRRVVELGLEGRITFCGRVSDEDLPAHYALCDLLVLPSTTMGEAFGIVLLEAMACGKPVVASNLPGVRTVVDEGVDGFLTEPCNVDDLTSKMWHLLNAPDIREQFGQTGRKKVEERYSWRRIGKMLERIYYEVLA
jgi:glycosyltransferase involved in cell wall biosynthesis